MKIHPFDACISKDEFSLDEKIYPQVLLICQIGHQIGIIASTGIEEVKNGRLKKHENILTEKAELQASLTFQRKSAIKPVLVTYPVVDEIENRIIEITKNYPPDFVWDFYPRIQIWAIQEEAFLKIFEDKVNHCYIADGHHRTACIEKLFLEKGKPFDHLMVGFFSTPQIEVHEYNRVLELNTNISTIELIRFLEEHTEVSALDSPQKSPAKGSIVMGFLNHYYLLEFEQDGLDVSFFQEKIYQNGFQKGIFTAIEYPEGPMNWSLENNKAGFCLFPMTSEELMATADKGKILPPKSTWITPRMVNGIIKMKYHA
jgi:uncharacterized protein (DUF1015 family)